MIYIPETTASGCVYYEEPSAYWGIDFYVGGVIIDGAFDALQEGLAPKKHGDTIPVAVVFDGQRYVTQAFHYAADGDISYFTVGNHSLFERAQIPDSEAEDTGEPFCVFVIRFSNQVSLVTTKDGESHTFSVMDLSEPWEDGGSGTISYIKFLCSPNSPYLPKNIFGWKLANKMSAPFLPDGYAELEYIESDGTQYIDTGYAPNQDTGFAVDFIAYDKIDKTEFGSIFGARESANTNELLLSTYGGYGGRGLLRCQKNYDAGLQSDVRMTATLRNHVYSTSIGYSLVLPEETFQSPVDLLIFANNKDGSVTEPGKVRLYSLKLYEGNRLIRDYVPCSNPDGQPGLWCKVGKQFYGFTAIGTASYSLRGNEYDAEWLATP